MQLVVATSLGHADLHCQGEPINSDDLESADAKAALPVECNGAVPELKSLPARLSTMVTGIPLDSAVEALLTGEAGSMTTCNTFTTNSLSPDDVLLSDVVHEGGFLRVFKGTWGSTYVAVTVFRALNNISLDNAFLTSACTFLRHPNIVQTFMYKELDMPSVTAAAWMIQEWCDRSSLKTYCSTPPPTMELLDIAFEIANACCYLHSCDIVHGNLVADNVLLKTSASSPKGYVCKVTGFRNSQTSTIASDDRLMLVANRRSLMHLPAETRFAADALQSIATSRRLTRKCDVFDFGLILWCAVCGKDLFEELTLPEISLVFQVNNGLCPSLPETISEDIKNLYGSCTASQPEARPTFATVSLNLLRCRWVREISSARAGNRAALLYPVIKTASEKHAIDGRLKAVQMHA